MHPRRPDSAQVRWLAPLALTLTLLLGSACESEPASPRWREVFRDLPGALISIWGTSETDVWTVGGDASDGAGPAVLHYDGSTWTRHDTGLEGVDLWWVHGFEGGPLFIGGSGGTILHRVGDGAFERQDTPGESTVFGLWGVDPTDVWAVGGEAAGSTGAFVWRWDGQAWNAVTLPAGAETAAYYKVWGTGYSDIWFVGTEGRVLRWDGAGFEVVDSGTTRTLLTVHAVPGHRVAVGGFGTATMIEHTGAGFADVTPPGTPQMIGVRLTGGGQGWAVGIEGSVMQRTGGAWRPVDTGLDLYEALHAVWVDPTGGVWAVGGQVLAPPLVQGTLIHRGIRPVRSTIVDAP